MNSRTLITFIFLSLGAFLSVSAQIGSANYLELCERGRVHMYKGEYDQALADLNEAIRLNPYYSRSYICKGLVYYTNLDFDQAIVDFSMVIKLDPGSYHAWENRGLSYFQKKRYDDAISDFESASKLYKKDTLSLIYEAAAYEKKRQVLKATIALSKLRQLGGTKVEGQSLVARAYSAADLHQLAVLELSKALMSEPGNIKVLTLRAGEYYFLKLRSKALADLSTTIKLSPNDPAVWGARGNYLYSFHLYDEAIHDFTECIRLAPRAMSWLTSRGSTYLFVKAGDKAKKDFNTAIRLSSEDPSAIIGSGFVKIYQADYANSIVDFNRVMAIDPHNPDAALGMIISLVRIYRFDLAQKYVALLKSEISYSSGSNKVFKFYRGYFTAASENIPNSDYSGALKILNTSLGQLTRNDVIENPGIFRNVLALKGYVQELLGMNLSAADTYRQDLSLNDQQHDLDEALKRITQGKPAPKPILDQFTSGPTITKASSTGASGGASQVTQSSGDLLSMLQSVDPERMIGVKVDGDLGDSILSQTQLINSFPDEAFAHTQRALYYLQAGHYLQAVYDCDTAILLGPSKRYQLPSNYGQTLGIRGIAYYRMRKYKEAIADLKKAVVLPGLPNLKDFREFYGLSLENSEGPSAAEPVFSALIRDFPGNYTYWSDRANCFYTMHDFRAALADFNQAIILNAQNADLFNSKAMCYSKMNLEKEAIVNFSISLHLDSTGAGTWNNRACSYERLWQYDKAAYDRNQAIVRASDVMGQYFRKPDYETDKKRMRVQHAYDMAVQFYDQKDYGNAILACDTILRQDSTDRHVYYRRAECYYEIGRLSYSLKDLIAIDRIESKGLITNSSDVVHTYTSTYWNMRGLCTAETDHVSAITAFTRAIDLMPNYIYFDNRGLSYSNAGKLDSAIADFNACIRLNPKHANAYNNIGLCYMLKGDYLNAIKYFNQSLSMNPNDFTSFFNKWASSFAIQTPGVSTEEFQAIRTKYPQQNVSIQYLQLLYDLMLGNYAEGVKIYRALPATRDALTDQFVNDGFINNYLAGCEYLANGQPKEAIRSLDIAMDLYNNSVKGRTDTIPLNAIYTNAMVASGDAYFLQGAYKKALENYQRAAVINPYGLVIKARESAAVKKIATLNEVPRTEPVRQRGSTENYYAVLIACDQYKYYTGLAPLHSCKEDALQLKAVLSKQYGFKGQNTDTLFDTDGSDLLIKLTARLSRLTPEDNLVIFYAGHGTLSGDIHPSSAWIPVDAKNEKEYVGPEKLAKLISGCQAGHILILSDACFSGSLNLQQPAQGAQSKSGEQRSCQVLTSSLNQTVSEKSTFVPAIIRALNENKLPQYDIYQLFNRVNLLVSARKSASGRIGRPEPQLYGFTNYGNQKGKFIFVRQ